jgi:hypothetical protein
MGRQHIRNGLLHVTQRKTGKVLAIPIHPDLQAVLATVPATQMTFLMTLRGKRFDPHAFTAWFAEACDKAAMSSACTFHGLRKAACRRLAEAGCTVHEIAAISGHASLHEVERYTKAADQAKLARAAMARAMAAHERVSVLWVIRNYEDDGESPTTYNIATAVYQIKPDKDGNDGSATRSTSPSNARLKACSARAASSGSAPNVRVIPPAMAVPSFAIIG